MESIAALAETTGGKIFLTIFVAMIPVIELRGAIPFGLALSLPYAEVFAAGVIGNMIPVPFIILFVRAVFRFLRVKSARLERLVQRLENRARDKAEIVHKYELIGLCIFVAIPLPGTGAWTGALIAAMFDIRLSKAFPVILLGVIIAGVIVTAISYGLDAFLLS